MSGARVNELNVFELWDKGLHFIAFFAGALPLVPALRLSGCAPWSRILLFAIVAISVYGALDEVHQHFTPSRSALDVGDWVADTLGAFAGTLLTAYIHARFEKSHRPASSRN